MSADSLELAACQHVLGLMLPEQLPDVASQALQQGHDSPSIRILAGLTASEVDDARALFDRCLGELNQPRPSRRDAVLRLARETATRILTAETTPYHGAKDIWNLNLLLEDQQLPELDPFAYAASEWEDRPGARQIFEEGILASARELVKL